MLEIAPGVTIIERRKTPCVNEPLSAATESLTKPSFSPDLSEISSGKKNTVVVVSDNIRPVPNEILLGSKCFEKGLRKLAQSADLDGYMSYISNMNNFEIDQWEVEELANVLRKARISLYASILDSEKASLGFADLVDDYQVFVDALFRSYPAKAVAVIPEGPYVVPRVSATG